MLNRESEAEVALAGLQPLPQVGPRILRALSLAGCRATAASDRLKQLEAANRVGWEKDRFDAVGIDCNSFWSVS